MTVAAALLLATAVAAAMPVAAEGLGKTGVRAESLGPHFARTGFSALEALRGGGLVAQRNGNVETFSADGTLQRAAVPQLPMAPSGGLEPSFELASGRVITFNTAWSLHSTSPASVDVAFANESTTGLTLSGLGQFALFSEIVATPDGGALVVGEDGYLVEIAPDGTPNRSFGHAGVLLTRPALASARVHADGSIIAVGSTKSWTEADFAIARYTATGAPDPLFGRGGVFKFDLGGNDEAKVVSWAVDGSLLVGGASEAIGECQHKLACEETPVLAAFDPNGIPDPNFGAAGALRLTALTDRPASVPLTGVKTLARRPDGSIVAAGAAAPRATVAFISALSAQGAPLRGFGDDGLVRQRKPQPASLEVDELLALPNGDLLVSAYTNVDRNPGPVLARFAPDGDLVKSFGDGRGWVPVGSSRPGGLAANSSGTVLLHTYSYPHSRLVELRAADGSTVASFGARGTITLPTRTVVPALGIDETGGAIVIANDDLRPGFVLRYREDGRLDPTFGRNGRARLWLKGRAVRGAAFGGLDRGRPLVGGFVHRFGGLRFAITRFLPNGRTDPSFGTRGWSVPFAGGKAKSMILTRVGPYIYLAGVVRRGEERPRLVLLRLDHDGHPDPSFGDAGRRVGPFPRGAEPRAIVPSHIGVLVVLNEGERPLVWFGRDGEVYRQWVGKPGRSVDSVQAAVSGRRRLNLGWADYSDVTEGSAYFFGRQRLP